MLGPNVTIATAGHPILPKLRQQGYRYNMTVRIGKNCRLGAGVIVMPGITIGDNAVIGAGSIVTKDIPHMSQRLAIRAVFCARSESVAGSTASKTGRSNMIL